MFRSIIKGRPLLSLRANLHRRMFPSTTPTKTVHRQLLTEANCTRPFDDIPGSVDPIPQEELIRFFTDSVNLFGEKYPIAIEQGNGLWKMSVKEGQNTVALLSHDAVKQWHQYELQYRTKRQMPSELEGFAGRAFSDIHGPAHSEWRKKVMPSFKPKTVGRFAPFIQHSAQRLLLDRIHEESEKGEFVQFCPTAKQFAYDIGSKFVYGPLLNEEERDYTFQKFQRFANGASPESIGAALNDPDNPDTPWADCLRAKDELNEYLAPKYVEAQRLTATDSWDSTFGEDADCLLRSILENDAEFTKPDYTLEDRVHLTLALAFAAYDTSATSMTHMIYSMWQNPEETEKVRDAIMAHPQLSDPETVFTFDLMKSCNELECFINESQRVHTFIPTMAPRVVHDEEGVEIAGYHLPKGTELIIPLQFLQNGEGSWTDPLEFRPSRFDKSNGEKKADRGSIGSYNHMPFATGLHKCLGMHLALMEMRMYSILLLRDWEFEIDESKLTEEGTVNHLNLTQSFPHFNVYLKLKKRQ